MPRVWHMIVLSKVGSRGISEISLFKFCMGFFRLDFYWLENELPRVVQITSITKKNHYVTYVNVFTMLKYQAEGKCITQCLKPTLWYISLSSCDSVGQSYYAKSEIFSFLETVSLIPVLFRTEIKNNHFCNINMKL